MGRPKKAPSIKAPSRMLDIMPDDQKYWRFMYKKMEALLDDYGFERIDTPLLESSDLFLRATEGLGEDSSREIFELKSRGGENLSVRADLTLSVMRAYIEQGMRSLPHPVKLFSRGYVVRDSGPEGSLRQRYYLSVLTIGDDSEVVDAELLFLGDKILKGLGLGNHSVHINSVGDASCSSYYIRALKDFFKNKAKKPCAQCRNNMKTNPVLLLSCMNQECRDVAKDAPQMVDFLDEQCKGHFKRILEFLDLAQVSYFLSPYMAGTYDYQTRTVFQFWPEEVTSPEPGARPVVFGGRYDKLCELLGGHKTPVAVLHFDVTQAVAQLKEKNVNVPSASVRPKVFLAQLSDAAKRKSLMLFEDIRKAGIEIRFSLSRDSIKSQLRIAARLGVKYTLIFGQKEALEKTVILREMETGIQETVPLEKLIDELKKRLKRSA